MALSFGAGFASGKEIYLFFYPYGNNAFIGFFLFAFVFSYGIAKTFQIMEQKNLPNYQAFIQEISPFGMKITNTIHTLLTIFLLLEFYIMIAGFGAYIEQEFQMPSLMGAIMLSSCTYFTCQKSMQGIKKVNQFMIPILILTIIHFGVKNVENLPKNLTIFRNQAGQILQMIYHSISYASYNLVLLIPVLLGFEKEIIRKHKRKISIISSLILGILAFFILTILLFRKTNHRYQRYANTCNHSEKKKHKSMESSLQ